MEKIGKNPESQISPKLQILLVKFTDYKNIAIFKVNILALTGLKIQ